MKQTLSAGEQKQGWTFLMSKGVELHESCDGMKIVKAYFDNGLMHCCEVNRL